MSVDKSFFGHLEMLLLAQFELAPHKPRVMLLRGFQSPEALHYCIDTYAPQTLYWYQGCHLDSVPTGVVVIHESPVEGVDCYAVAQAHICAMREPEWLSSVHQSLVVGGVFVSHGLAVDSFSKEVLDGSVPLMDMVKWGDWLQKNGWEDSGVALHEVMWDIESVSAAERELAYGAVDLSCSRSNREVLTAVSWPQSWSMRVLLAHARKSDARHVVSVPISALRRRYQALDSS